MSGKSGRLRLLCRKTELCRFHLKGACKRGAACDFAHKEEDMRVKPDLQRTKPCPVVLDGGECKDPECPFAHRSGELRKFKPQITAASFAGTDAASEQQQGAGSIGKPGLDSQATTEDGTESSSGSQPEESSDLMGSLNNDKPLFQPEAGGLSRQTTAFSDGGWTRQTSGFSEGGLSRQISSESETPLRPENKKHKTRLCSFHMMGKCRKDNCTFAHGTAELALPPGGSVRSSTKASTDSSQTATPPPSWPSETTSEDGTYNSGQPPPSSCGDDQEWPMTMKTKSDPGEEEEMDPSEKLLPSWQSCADEAVGQLVVINTFLTILDDSDRPKVLRRTRSAPSLGQ